jgi:hypothetical protein
MNKVSCLIYSTCNMIWLKCKRMQRLHERPTFCAGKVRFGVSASIPEVLNVIMVVSASIPEVLIVLTLMCSGMAERLTRRTSDLRIFSFVCSYPVRGKSLFPWARNFTLIVQHWLVPEMNIRDCSIGLLLFI